MIAAKKEYPWEAKNRARMEAVLNNRIAEHNLMCCRQLKQAKEDTSVELESSLRKRMHA